jgi:hypothetical protein
VNCVCEGVCPWSALVILLMCHLPVGWR